MGAKRTGLSAAEHDLKATSADLSADAARLQRIEDEKTDLRSDDPRLVELSREAEALTGEMSDKAKAESALVDELQPDPA
jgi:hypothetical protein